jgi:hypothetical protein
MPWSAASACPSMRWALDLQQDANAVPGPTSDLGRRHPEFSHSDTAAFRRSYGPRPVGSGTAPR